MGDKPGRATAQQTDVDEYLKTGAIPNNDGYQYADAARNEIWHVHAKAGDVVFVNRDDPRSRTVEMEVENGGQVIPVSQRDFIRNGGRIGTDQYGNQYPPFAWQSHPDVPTFEQSRGPYSMPPVRRDGGVDIFVEIGNDGRGHVYRSNGRWGDQRGHADCGCGNHGGGPIRYPHTGRDWDPDWQGTVPRQGYPRTYPHGGYPQQGGHFPHGGRRYPHQNGAEIGIGVDIPIGNHGRIRIGTEIPIGDQRRRWR
ncbi:MAG: hypothetical protein U0105_16140 [Candidatus Obscuribacterales bacterium]